MSKTLKKTGHSSYWLNEDLWFNEDEDTEVGKPANDITKIMKLATVRRAISNFVSILSGENVPVYFQGEDSYTDGKMVVIAADDNPANFDVAVGLALHEASHILLSDFTWLQAINTYVDHLSYRDEPTFYYTGKTIGEAAGRHVAPITKNGLPFIDNIFRSEINEAIIKTYAKLQVDNEGQLYNSQFALSMITKEYISHIKTIMNILEDRRIDQYVYTKAMGYRPYYNALYEKYFYTKEAGKLLRFDSEARIPNMENYINHMIYHIHPDSDPDALPGLRAIFKEMDLNNVYKLAPNYDKPIDLANFSYDMTPKLWQKANDIMVMIIKYVDLYIEFEKNGGNTEGDGSSEGDTKQGTSTDNQNTAGDSNGEGSDSEPSTPEDMKPRAPQTPANKRESASINQNKAEKDLDKVKDLMNGEAKKKKISKALASSVRAFEEAQGEMVSVSVAGLNKVNCMVTRDISEKLLGEDWFLFSHGMNDNWVDSRMVEAINAGRRMGQILHQRLQIRNDPMTTRQTRLSSGKIERRLLANLGMDNTDVFYRSRTDKHKPVMLHLTIDASGSMHGSKFRETITVATAMAFLSNKMENVDCVISLRGGEKFPIVAVVFDSRRDHFRKWMKFAPHLTSNGNTPEGLCFAATMDIILESKGTHDVYFINFSDGMPGFLMGEEATITTGPTRSTGQWYHNEVALDHTRKMVRHLKENGVKVLSYFIADNEWGRDYLMKDFSYMYGDSAQFVDVTSVTNVLNTMNKMLMKR
jgi:hypothetical protein